MTHALMHSGSLLNKVKIGVGGVRVGWGLGMEEDHKYTHTLMHGASH